MIKNYDPNITWARHTYEVTLQVWDYVGTKKCSMGGNLKGFEVMRAAVEALADDLYEEQGDNPLIVLKKRHGDETLECQPDGEELDSWLLEMVVGVNLIEHKEEL